MSVLIKGMEMPTSCRGCKLYHYIEGTGCFSCDVLPGLDDGVELKPWKNRRKDCPLVPVPPHGRLIDADALRESFRESIEECRKWADEVSSLAGTEDGMYARISQSLGTFVECSLRTKAAPTIIEAEEEET